MASPPAAEEDELTSASPAPQDSPATPLEADNDAVASTKMEMPLTMAQSVILTSLPKDTTKALEGAGNVDVEKVTVRFHAIGSAPLLRQKAFKVASHQRFEAVVRFLRKKLGKGDGDSVFCYVNSVFAPGLDEGVGNLWRCFKVNEELVVHYSINAAFG